MSKTSYWSITELFPRFDSTHLNMFRSQCSKSEKSLLESMFQVDEIVNQQRSSEFLISTSLYCRPHNPGAPRIDPITVETLKLPHQGVRNGRSWWDTYLQPLIRDISRIKPPWVLRIHLSAELYFLIPLLRHQRVEFWIMNHPSENTVPGMLWRYLPLEEGTNLVARGTDSLWPDQQYWASATQMLKGPCRFYRNFFPTDMDRIFLVYRSIPGPLVVRQGLKLPFIEYAKAWIWFQWNDLWPRTASTPPGNEMRPKFGLSHWAKYGQDEQFLSHWLYYIACEEGLYTVTSGNNKSEIFKYDRNYVKSRSEHSMFIEWMP